MSGLPVPNAAALTNQYTTAPTGVVTLSPGVYSSLTVSGSTTTVTISPGVYYLKGPFRVCSIRGVSRKIGYETQTLSERSHG